MTEIIHSNLNAFEQVSLTELNQVALLNRLDAKYVIQSERIPELIERLSKHYLTLNINGHKSYNYSTLYYDTPENTMYNNHVRGKLNRYKVRRRKYNDTNESFLEVKFKTNKNRTIKSRIKQPFHLWKDDPLEKDFLKEYIPYNPETLIPVVENNFNRITLTDKNFTHRVTMDYQISFKKVCIGTDCEKEFPLLGIIELKKSKDNQSVFLESILREMRLLPMGFSKYCYGKIMTDPLTTNPKLLKPKLRRLEKLTDYALLFN